MPASRDQLPTRNSNHHGSLPVVRSLCLEISVSDCLSSMLGRCGQSILNTEHFGFHGMDISLSFPDSDLQFNARVVSTGLAVQLEQGATSSMDIESRAKSY